MYCFPKIDEALCSLVKLDMNDPVVIARITEYRKLTAAHARAEGCRLGLNKQDLDSFLFSADSNAIWDAEQGRPYTAPVYTAPAPQLIVPMYDELGFLSDSEYKRIMGRERK
jgi:hypothetical protein